MFFLCYWAFLAPLYGHDLDPNTIASEKKSTGRGRRRMKEWERLRYREADKRK